MDASPVQPTSQNDLIMSTNVWFEDGTIVIQAESTVFRVYKGILQRDSTVFNDMFSIPQPDDAPTFWGAPLVELKDEARELEIFLDTLHQWRQSPTKITFRRSLVVAKLAAKYCVDDLQQWGVRPVKALYNPNSASGWIHDRVQFQGGWNPTGKGLKLEYLDRRKLTPSDHITVVNLARKIGVAEVLPVAFYAAATSLSMEEIIGGVVVSSQDSRSGDDPASHTPAPRVYQFDDPKDAEICAEGQRRLGTVFNPIFHLSRALIATNYGCANGTMPAPTRPLCTKMLDDQIPKAPYLFTSNHPLAYERFTTSVPNLRTLKRFCREIDACSRCKIVLRDACKSYEEWVWTNLKFIFQLAPA